MMPEKPYDLIVIGAGAGGLTVAIGAAKAGKRVFLAEKDRFGGDCTNFGCIPSKSLIASSKCAHAILSAQALGIKTSKVTLDTAGALDRVRLIVEKVRAHEEPEALRKLGITTALGAARFVDSHTLLIGDDQRQVIGKKIVIATGSHPFAPPIPGLETLSYLTNETVFELKEVPKSLFFIGSGPIGCELAQAFARLGSKVSMVSSRPYLLTREDPDARRILTEVFAQEGLLLYLGFQTKQVKGSGKGVEVTLEREGEEKVVTASQLFIGTGRRPNCHGLDLDRADVAWTEQGIKTDAYGRTSQRHIYAIGDVTGQPFFTHRAENQARTVLKSLLLPFSKKQSLQPIPRCTYTDPEIASIGLQEKEAIERYGARKIATYTISLADIDRNITSGRTEGFVKIITKKWSSAILGATFVSPRAGEMLMQISTAMFARLPLRKLADLIHPYPIESLAVRKAADLWLTQTLLPSLLRWIGKKGPPPPS